MKYLVVAVTILMLGCGPVRTYEPVDPNGRRYINLIVEVNDFDATHVNVFCRGGIHDRVYNLAKGTTRRKKVYMMGRCDRIRLSVDVIGQRNAWVSQEVHVYSGDTVTVFLYPNPSNNAVMVREQ